MDDENRKKSDGRPALSYSGIAVSWFADRRTAGHRADSAGICRWNDVISFLGAVANKHLEIWGSFLCVALGSLLCISWMLI